MPATTSRGYPYPVGSDAVNIVGDIQGLAEAVDTDVTSSLAGKLSTTGGGTVTGNISASTAPTLGAHLTNKTYVDTQDQKYLPLVGGQISSTLWVDGGMRLGGNGAQLIIVDTAVDSVLHSYIAFYGQGTSVASPGTRLGYVGFPGQNHLYIQNEVAGGAISVNSATDGVDIGADNNRPVNVYNEGVVTASFHPTALLVGKTTGDMGSGAGTELWSRGPNNGFDPLDDLEHRLEPGPRAQRGGRCPWQLLDPVPALQRPGRQHLPERFQWRQLQHLLRLSAEDCCWADLRRG